MLLRVFLPPCFLPQPCLLQGVPDKEANPKDAAMLLSVSILTGGEEDSSSG